MKRLIIGLSLIMLLLVSISCASEDTESRNEEERPALTEEQEKQWSEKGTINVSTLEEASRLAGYSVATPSFIPEGFKYSELVVAQLGLPPELGGEWGDGTINVMQGWSWPGYPAASLMLIQIPGKEQEGSGEPIDICGRPGWEKVHEANGRSHPLLQLNWYENDMRYSLAGTLVEPLTEEVILQIACSVE